MHCRTYRVPEVRGMRIRCIERQPRLKENIRATSCSAQRRSPNRCRCGWGEPISFRSHPCRAAVRTEYTQRNRRERTLWSESTYQD